MARVFKVPIPVSQNLRLPTPYILTDLKSGIVLSLIPNRYQLDRVRFAL